MSLEYIYDKMPDEHKLIVKSSLTTNSIQILLHDAKVECQDQLFFIDDTLSSDDFKLRYIELKKSVQAYDTILNLIDKLKQGDLQ